VETNCSGECECLASKKEDLIDLQSEVETYIAEQIDELGLKLKILDLILEDSNLEGFKVRLAHAKHLAFIDLKAIYRAYEPAIRKIGLNTWDNFSDDNKVQLSMIKFQSIEERISESQPASKKENHSQSAMVDSLTEQFELFRYDSQLQMDEIKTKIPELAEEIREDNRNMRDENRELRNEYR
jgi:hypothetical protein